MTLRGPGAGSATAQHRASVWGSSLVMLPALGVAPPVWESGAAEAAIDAFHQLVHATATSVAWSLLDD